MEGNKSTVYLEEVIVSRLSRLGNGKTTPIRVITEVYTKQGELIASHDPEYSYSIEQLENLADYMYKHVEVLINDPQALLQNWIQTRP